MAEQDYRYSEEDIIAVMIKAGFQLVLEADEYHMRCYICDKSLHDARNTIIRCPCRHFLHSTCIIRFLRCHAKCPHPTCLVYHVDGY